MRVEEEESYMGNGFYMGNLHGDTASQEGLERALQFCMQHRLCLRVALALLSAVNFACSSRCTTGSAGCSG
jgi:hypothetical protein